MNYSRQIRSGLSVLFLVITLSGCASQQTGVTANTAGERAFKPFHNVVDMAFVEQHLSIPMQDGVMLIDARPYKPKYIKGLIPMAISSPNSQFDKMTDKLPADKNSLLIFYCGGLKCKLSHKSAAKAEQLGYTNVKVFAEGYPKWISEKSDYPAVSAEWVKSQIDGDNKMTLVDRAPNAPSTTKAIFLRPSAFPTCSLTSLQTSCLRIITSSSCSIAAACTAN